MTYEFFKNEIKKLGLNYYISNHVISVAIGFEDVCYVYTNKRYSTYFYNEFHNLDENVQKKVFRLVFGLARTSLENRGKLYEDKWYLKHKYLNKWNGENYLRQDMGKKDLSLGNKNTDGIIWTCKFTKDEIEELMEIINLNDFEMEE